MSNITLKASFQADVRRVSVPIVSTYEQIKQTLTTLFELPQTFSIKYQDEDGDFITITSDLELTEAINLSKNKQPSMLRIFVDMISNPVNKMSDSLNLTGVVIPSNSFLIEQVNQKQAEEKKRLEEEKKIEEERVKIKKDIARKEEEERIRLVELKKMEALKRFKEEEDWKNAQAELKRAEEDRILLEEKQRIEELEAEEKRKIEEQILLEENRRLLEEKRRIEEELQAELKQKEEERRLLEENRRIEEELQAELKRKEEERILLEEKQRVKEELEAKEKQREEELLLKRKSYIHDIKCANCSKNQIIGARYKCVNCESYDICEECEGKNLHRNDHVFLKIYEPWKQNFKFIIPNFYQYQAPTSPATVNPLQPLVLPVGYQTGGEPNKTYAEVLSPSVPSNPKQLFTGSPYKYAKQLETIRSIFEQIDVNLIKSLLEKHGGIVDLAISELMG